MDKKNEKIVFFSLQKLMFRALKPKRQLLNMLRWPTYIIENSNFVDYFAAPMQFFTKYLPLDSVSGQFLMEFI